MLTQSQSQHRVFAVFIVSLVLKLVLSAFIPPASDEAYYWAWTKFLSLSYFDHPPMIAWILKAGADLAPSYLFRWPIVLMGQASFGIWLWLLRKELSPSQLFQFSLLMCLSPVMGLGSLLATPDVPYMFFWSLAIFSFVTVFRNHSILNYASLGVLLGLGFCSKYHMAIFIPIILWYLISTGRYRELTPWKVAVAVVLGAATAFPVFAWNAQNNWASFRFQIDHGLNSETFTLRWTFEYLLGQFLLIFPTIVLLCLKRPSERKGLANVLWYFAWGPILFFLLSSFRAPTQMNWPIAAIPAFFAMASSRATGWKYSLGHNILWLGFFTYVGCAIAFGKSNLLPGKLLDPVYFKPLVDEGAQLKKLKPLYGGSYQMASVLWFYFDQPVYKLFQASRVDHYDLLSQSKPMDHLFYVVMDKADDLPAWLFQAGFKAEKIREIGKNFEVFRVKKD